MDLLEITQLVSDRDGLPRQVFPGQGGFVVPPHCGIPPQPCRLISLSLSGLKAIASKGKMEGQKS